MRLIFLSFLCGAALCSVMHRHIWYYSYPKTWQDAQTYCRSAGGELFTIVTQSDINRVHIHSYYAWIGLRRYSSWRWFDGTNYYNANLGDFVKNETDKDDDCALAKYTYDKAVGGKCEERHFFFCHYQEDNTRKYKFYINTTSWDEAFLYCQNTNQFLAIFNDWQGDLPSDKMRNFPVWTGLYHDVEWRWSDGEHSDYRNWAEGSHPDPNPGPGLCGSMWSLNRNMSVHSCSEAFPFLCYSHNLILVQQNLTWEDALEHCRSLKTVSPYVPHHLLSVEQSELVYANSKAMHAQTDKVWLGLRFLGGFWFWSDGQTVSLSGLPSCPESKLSCGALVLDRTSNGSEPQPTIELHGCSERLNFLCYRLW